jgi:lipopolysaccharide export system ATP-binding protein
LGQLKPVRNPIVVVVRIERIVDPIAVGEIQEIIRMLRQAGLAILITDHTVRETLNIVDRAYLIFEGQVRRHGSKDFLVNDDEARRLYLGEGFTM